MSLTAVARAPGRRAEATPEANWEAMVNALARVVGRRVVRQLDLHRPDARPTWFGPEAEWFAISIWHPKRPPVDLTATRDRRGVWRVRQ